MNRLEQPVKLTGGSAGGARLSSCAFTKRRRFLPNTGAEYERQSPFGRRYMLSASHRLHSDALTPEQNQQTYGKCNNPHGHGHNYIIEVMVAGPVDPETGMVLNLVALDEVVRKNVIGRFDHTNLNFDPLFANQVPTTENLCRTVFAILKDTLPAGELEHVRVEETENNFFQCYGTGRVPYAQLAEAPSGSFRTKQVLCFPGQEDKKNGVADSSKQAGPQGRRRRTVRIHDPGDVPRDPHAAGQDPDRDGLSMTPSRVEKSMSFLTKGYDEDPSRILRGALFDVDYDEMVIVRDIEMFSLCEHHMLPFFGKVHVAYIPKLTMVGDVRRAKLYYLRKKIGKQARVREKQH